MTRSELVARLTGLGVPEAELNDLPELTATVTGLMVYGSRARGDAVSGSDLDLLALVPAQLPAISVGAISVSFYTSAQLATGISSLFGAHLKRDGMVLFDDDGKLDEALNRMGPVDTKRLLSRVRAMSALFTVPRQVVGRISSCSKLGMVGSARPVWTSAGRFQAIASCGRTWL
ncbi:MAG: nucleotidyltransferase domain-containing protein [Micrococcales bacterium]|nr:nucleotidyltransferase domain-containing protein [Micrococcales bacterium]